MRKTLLALLAIVSCTISFGQNFQSKSSGDWNLPATWQTWNGTTWVDATVVPDDASGTILVRSGHNVVVKLIEFADQLTVNGTLTIDPGAELIVEQGSGSDLTLANGTLTGTGTLTMNGDFEWWGGTLSRSYTVASGKTLLITTPGTKFLGANLTNDAGGTITWDGGHFYVMNNGTTLQNNGSFNANLSGVTTNYYIQTYTGTPAGFNNAGTFTKSGTGILNLYTPFVNTGSLSIAGAVDNHNTMSLNGGTSFTGTGTFTNASILNINVPISFGFQFNSTAGTINGAQDLIVNNTSPASFTLNGNYNGAGDLTVNSDMVMNGTFNAADLTVTGNMTLDGTLNAGGTFVVGGPSFTWNNGGLHRAYAVNSGETMAITTTGTKFLGANLTNDVGGTITWDGGFFYLMNNGTIFQNNGAFNANLNGPTTNYHLLNYTGTPLGINNSGTFTKSGTGILNVNTPFVNTGAIDIAGTLINQNTLSLNGGTNFTGTGTFSNSSVLNINVPVNMGFQFNSTGGTINAAEDLTVNNSSSFALNGTFNGPGDLTVNSDFTMNGTYNGGHLVTTGNMILDGNLNVGGNLVVGGPSFTWRNGGLHRAYAVNSGETMSITTGGTKFLGANLTNDAGGTITWDGGHFYVMNNGTTLQNNGSFNANLSGVTTNYYIQTYTGTPAGFNNAGTFTKSGTGILNLYTPFVNTGSLSIAGALNNHSTMSLNGGTSFTGTGTFTNASTLNINVPINMGFQFNTTGGTINAAQDLIVNNTSPASLTLNGTYAGLGDLVVNSDLILNGTFSATDLNVTGNMTLDGILNSGGNFSVGGPTFTWKSGSLHRPYSVNNSETMSINTTGTKFLGANLTNDAGGTITWDGGHFYLMNNGTTLQNNGTFTSNVPGTANHYIQTYTGTPSGFNNAGTLNKTGTGTLNLQTPFVNTGAISLSQGTVHNQNTLSLNGGTSFTGSGTLSNASTLNINTPVNMLFQFISTAGTINAAQDLTVNNTSPAAFTLNGTYNGLGDLSVNSDFTLNGIYNGGDLVTTGNMTLDGNLNVGGTLSVGGPSFTWRSGNLHRAYAVNSGETMTITTTASKNLGANLTNDAGGTITWDNGSIHLQNNGTFNANLPGSHNLQTISGTPVGFNNAGTFTKSGTGILNFFTDFNNLNTGKFYGSGTVNSTSSNFTNNGMITPGNAVTPDPAILTFTGDQPFSANSTYEVYLNGITPGTQMDQLVRTSPITLAGRLNVDEGNVMLGTPYRIIRIIGGTASSISGTFTPITGEAYEYTASIVTDGGDAFLELIPNKALPLHLLDFTGTLSGSKVVLNWKTSGEMNTARFEIERAARPDGAFTRIGETPAAGSSTAELKYSFTDAKPLAGLNFYRLKMVDLNGQYEHSRKVSVRLNGVPNSFTLFPNPIRTGELQLQIVGLATGNMTLELRDMSSRLVQQKSLRADTETLFTSMDVTQLKAGMYTLTLRTDNTLVTKTFVKQ